MIPSFARPPGRGVWGYVCIAAYGLGGRVLLRYTSPKHFDDSRKKKIITESVRTSSAGSRSKGSGLWLGHFMRRSFRAVSGCCCAIRDAIVDSVYDSILVRQEHCHKKKHCHKKRHCPKKEKHRVCFSAR
jgi:hypothetical protein